MKASLGGMKGIQVTSPTPYLYESHKGPTWELSVPHCVGDQCYPYLESIKYDVYINAHRPRHLSNDIWRLPVLTQARMASLISDESCDLPPSRCVVNLRTCIS